MPSSLDFQRLMKAVRDDADDEALQLGLGHRLLNSDPIVL